MTDKYKGATEGWKRAGKEPYTVAYGGNPNKKEKPEPKKAEPKGAK